jgi:capsular polysaccharide transport system permease protein
VVPVVDANLPVRALYPERTKIVLTAFLSLLLIYGIGWLIAAGVREHAA